MGYTGLQSFNIIDTLHGVYFRGTGVREPREPDERTGGAVHDTDR